jgi:hypothetical protein
MPLIRRPPLPPVTRGACDDHHGERPDECAQPRGESLAGNESGARSRGDEQSGEHAGIAFPDDLDA